MGWVYVLLVAKPTKYMTLSGVGVVGPFKVSKIPLSDHGVHLKGLQPPPSVNDVSDVRLYSNN